MDNIFLEDCRNVMESCKYDYLFTSPPDFEEIGLDPSNPEIYQTFLHDVFEKATPKKKVLTIVLTDRKFSGSIIPKSSIVKSVLFDLGWKLLTHKIWVKTTKIDGYRLTYGNILTFGMGKVKQNMHKEFKPDVWMDGRGDKFKKYSYGMPVDIPRKCILNYTDPYDVVFDPFMGSGTTAVAAIKTDRHYMGSEISEEYYSLAGERIELETNTILRHL